MSWEWDETLFAGTARYYEQGRLPHSDGLADAFASEFGTSGGLLDVGCGPGTVALRVARTFDEVVGVDPDPGMIGEARRLATDRAIDNATFVQRRAEELPAGLGEFDVVTLAASFHWMVRDQVARTVKAMLSPGGVVVHLDTATPADQAPLRYPAPPKPEIAELVMRYLGPERRAGRYVGFVSPSGEEAIFRGAGLIGPRVVIVPGGRVFDRGIDDEVAATLSMTYSAPHLFGGRFEAFRRDLVDLLTTASPDGYFSVRQPDTKLIIWSQSLAATSR